MRARGGLDIKDFGSAGRVSEVGFDLSPTISLLEVWGYAVRCNSALASALEVTEEKRKDIIP